ncbi:lysine decarboxylase-like protein-like protein [Pseudovirgaria hyperparasitica]|uniref:Lysine decarboxylase-like protein-like protein n=1 Tax=Pseudovirgaria hyperparasitica TaxID=470096 RepID=A0A6A6VZS5_9PEZI|nr:lysine decarboxylase-like protein-like protein [Pseudovirgaria hyperparasitica]KAF2755180.1 lysine decarboxylase-like protein-like protein [Pseudovirgaria hyperparasitica]
MNEPTAHGHQSLSEHLNGTKTNTRPVVCVFCGASDGTTDVHLKAAEELAHKLHDANAKLVYGGGNTGIMGMVARTLVSLSGPDSVHGVIPHELVKHEMKRSKGGLDENVVGRVTKVNSMHERKDMMAKEVVAGGPGSGFVALSGGFGTLEELAEVTTWNQLGIHDRPVVVFNVDGYWDGLFQWLRTAVKAGFVNEDSAPIMAEAKTADEAMKALQGYVSAKGRFDLDWEKK